MNILSVLTEVSHVLGNVVGVLRTMKMDQELTLGTEAHKTEEQDQVPGLLTRNFPWQPQVTALRLLYKRENSCLV